MLQIVFETPGGTLQTVPSHFTEEETEAQREGCGVANTAGGPSMFFSLSQTASFPAMASYLSLPEGSLWHQEHTQPAGRTGQMCQEVTTVTA